MTEVLGCDQVNMTRSQPWQEEQDTHNVCIREMKVLLIEVCTRFREPKRNVSKSQVAQLSSTKKGRGSESCQVPGKDSSTETTTSRQSDF